VTLEMQVLKDHREIKVRKEYKERQVLQVGVV
jgi:hypothetical protein